MKITRIETIPITMPVGFFKDGMCKVEGVDALLPYYPGKPLRRRRRTTPEDAVLLDKVIVKIHTD